MAHLAPEKFLSVLQEMQAPNFRQKGCQQVGFHGLKGPRLYIPAAGKTVRWLDLNGWTDDAFPSKGKLGPVTKLAVPADLSEEETLAAFRALVERMKELPVFGTRAGAPRPILKAQEDDVPQPPKPGSPADRLTRRDLILSYSLKSGVPISSRTLAEWTSNGDAPTELERTVAEFTEVQS